MHIDPSQQTKADNYKLLTNLVVPRPIAWVTSVSPSGIVNVAPFSFFNAVGSDPMYVVVSVGNRDDGSPKDTAANIAASGEFVVNLVTEDLLGAMNISAADFPPDVSEVIAANLDVTPSIKVGAPYLSQAQAALECKLYKSEPLGAYTLFIGEVVMFHIANALVGPRLRINGFEPVGRLGSPSVYCRTRDRFDFPRISYSGWMKRRD